MDKYLINITKHFETGEIISISPYGEGHIHETYLALSKSHSPDFILQKINREVFRDIPCMMDNIEKVTRHICSRLKEIPGHQPDLESLSLIYTSTGRTFYEDEAGHCWRMYKFIPDTISYQQMTDPALAFEAGRAIGFFQAILTDLRSTLAETIPGFHDIDSRIGQYENAKSSDSSGRAGDVQDDLYFAESRFTRMKSYYRSLKDEAVIRATHNDTKLNNILFDCRGRAQCMIDLDTVMPGYIHFDYGDALRTMTNTALEDEADLSKVLFNRDIYESFSRGYLAEAGGFLLPAEKELLSHAPVYLTFIIGLRFLTDHLNGDVYYRIHHPGHNLERARVQFKLVKEMERSLFGRVYD